MDCLGTFQFQNHSGLNKLPQLHLICFTLQTVSNIKAFNLQHCPAFPSLCCNLNCYKFADPLFPSPGCEVACSMQLGDLGGAQYQHTSRANMYHFTEFFAAKYPHFVEYYSTHIPSVWKYITNINYFGPQSFPSIPWGEKCCKHSWLLLPYLLQQYIQLLNSSAAAANSLSMPHTPSLPMLAMSSTLSDWVVSFRWLIT